MRRLGGGVDGLLRDSQLGTERPQADGGVGDLAQGVGDGGVIARDRLGMGGLRTAQFALQASGREQRQRDRRTDAADARAVLGQPVQPSDCTPIKADRLTLG